MKFLLRGVAFAGRGAILLETEIQVPSPEDVRKQAEAEVNRMFLIERNAVRLQIFDECGTLVDEVAGPTENCPRPCEGIAQRPDGTWGPCPSPARYRYSFYDSSAEECEAHLMSEERRREWYASGTLERIYDLQRKVPLHPVNLESLRPSEN